MERHAPAIMGISGAYGGMLAAGTLMPPLGIPLGYIGGGIGGLATGKVMQKFVFEKEAREREKQKTTAFQDIIEGAEQGVSLNPFWHKEIMGKALKEMSERKKKKAITEFEQTIGMAELKALSNISLERPLTNNEYERMMELKKLYLK